MTVAIAHQPSQRLPMSPIDPNTRRLSARLQQKGASQGQHDGHDAETTEATSAILAGARKRKAAYEEEDDGFTFSRVRKNKKTRNESNDKSPPAMLPVQNEAKVRTAPITKETATPTKNEVEPKKRRPKMSFSTPNVRNEHQQRRSKRLSNDATARAHTPPPTADQTIIRTKRRLDGSPKPAASQRDRGLVASDPPSKHADSAPVLHAETKIALLTSDTPVIRRNKAMREGRGSRGERRSSLGLRGRRASSLIDTGTSNAIPHHEVSISDFYKHIGSEQLEPRRMRQLLTWCATRSMHAKPQGSEFNDAHKIMSARAIEEELLKELANRPDLSDWFTRDDLPVLNTDLPQRPNPKNIQNTEKIAELEIKIQRLQLEKDALQGILRQPAIPSLPTAAQTSNGRLLEVDKTLLDESDAAALAMLESCSAHTAGIAQRMNNITGTLGPLVDTFADGIHKVAQYRTAADEVASRVLSICANRLAHRETEGRKRALQSNVERHPTQDMSSVLRGLSRVDR